MGTDRGGPQRCKGRSNLTAKRIGCSGEHPPVVISCLAGDQDRMVCGGPLSSAGPQWLSWPEDSDPPPFTASLAAKPVLSSIPARRSLRDYQGPQCFSIPGNHDWIDGLETFQRHFQHKGWLGGWLLPQSGSYFALRLPHGWWLLALDLALVGDIGENSSPVAPCCSVTFLISLRGQVERRRCFRLSAFSPTVRRKRPLFGCDRGPARRVAFPPPFRLSCSFPCHRCSFLVIFLRAAPWRGGSEDVRADMVQYQYFANLAELRMGPTDRAVIVTHEPMWLVNW